MFYYILKSFKPTIIIALGIPIGLFVDRYLCIFSNITLNIISLSGLSLGVGMLVDNEVWVVIENISKMRENKMSAAKASVCEFTKQVSRSYICIYLASYCIPSYRLRNYCY